MTAAQDFDALGFHEQLFTMDGQYAGSRFLGPLTYNPEPSRKLGAPGLKKHVITKDFRLRKAYGDIVIKCSESEPFKCISMVVKYDGKKVKQ